MEVKDTGYGWLMNLSSYGSVNGKAEVDYVCNNHGTLTIQGQSFQTIIDLRAACDRLIAELEPDEDIVTQDTRPFYAQDARFYSPELCYYVHDVVSPPSQNIIVGAFLTMSEAIDFCAKRRGESNGRQYAISTMDELGL